MQTESNESPVTSFAVAILALSDNFAANDFQWGFDLFISNANRYRSLNANQPSFYPHNIPLKLTTKKTDFNLKTRVS